MSTAQQIEEAIRSLEKAERDKLPFVWFTVRETKGKTLEQMKDATELQSRTAQ